MQALDKELLQISSSYVQNRVKSRPEGFNSKYAVSHFQIETVYDKDNAKNNKLRGGIALSIH